MGMATQATPATTRAVNTAPDTRAIVAPVKEAAITEAAAVTEAAVTTRQRVNGVME